MLSDIEIARQARTAPLDAVGAAIGLSAEDLIPYGKATCCLARA